MGMQHFLKAHLKEVFFDGSDAMEQLREEQGRLLLRQMSEVLLRQNVQTDKHINHINSKKRKEEEEAKQKDMNEYMKDDEARIEALQKIWKTVRPYNFKRL